MVCRCCCCCCCCSFCGCRCCGVESAVSLFPLLGEGEGDLDDAIHERLAKEANEPDRVLDRSGRP